jgi:hypothetical protein
MKTRKEIMMDRVWRALFIGSLIFFVLMTAFSMWLWWPYPQVTAVPGTVLVNEPEDGTYQTGDVVRWTTTQVCQPAGQTFVTVTARLVFPRGISDTPVVERDFILEGDTPFCIDNNPTSLWLPGSLPTGTYQVLITACVPNPTPRDKCDTFEGPTFSLERIPLAEGATL